MKINIYVCILIQFFGLFLILESKDVTTVANRGSGVIELLKRYNLSTNKRNIEYFQIINSGNFDRNGGLLLNETYKLPIFVVAFDGKTIRTTLNI